MQLVTIAFLFVAMLGLGGVLFIQREVTLNYLAIRRGTRNGLTREVALMLVILLSVLVITGVVMVAVGLGSFFHETWVLYLLIIVPPVKFIGALLVVRSMRRQTHIIDERRRKELS